MNDKIEKVEHTIRFTRIEMANIVDKGANSNDDGETYKRLAELANDFGLLVSAFGPVFGRLLYWLPVSWKAKVYINEHKKNTEKDLKYIAWIIADENGQTVGSLSLDQVDKDKYVLNDELQSMNLYNIGLILSSDYQRRGLATELSKHLLSQLPALQIDMDALFIATLPNNAGVNTLAKRLGFTFVAETDAKFDGLIPCFSSSHMPANIYIKRVTE